MCIFICKYGIWIHKSSLVLSIFSQRRTKSSTVSDSNSTPTATISADSNAKRRKLRWSGARVGFSTKACNKKGLRLRMAKAQRTRVDSVGLVEA